MVLCRGGILPNKTTNLSILILLYHPSQNMMDVAMVHIYNWMIVKIMCFNIYAAYSI